MLPVVSFKDEDLGKKLRSALEDVGFLALKDHEAESLAKRLREVGHAFFERPSEEKERISLKNFRGYSGLGSEVTSNKRDWHECLDFGPEVEPR